MFAARNSLLTAAIARVAQTITISADTQNYLLNTAKVTGYSAGNTDVTLVINSGIYIGSASTGSYALTVNSSWAVGDTVTVVNNGFIVGAGGAGGKGNTGGTNAGSGGPAVSVARTTVITNNGTVGGGGGGGSGGNAAAVTYKGSTLYYGGGGGGGGQGYNGGAGGPLAPLWALGREPLLEMLAQKQQVEVEVQVRVVEALYTMAVLEVR